MKNENYSPETDYSYFTIEADIKFMENITHQLSFGFIVYCIVLLCTRIGVYICVHDVCTRQDPVHGIIERKEETNLEKRRQRVVVLMICAILALSLFCIIVGDHLQQAKEAQVLSGFQQLLAKEQITVAEVLRYLEEKLTSVSRENAARLVLGLEETQQKNLAKWEKRYADLDLQKEIFRIYQKTWTFENLGDTSDQDLKALLLETTENGFKVETAEGHFFPVIDYTFYRQYYQKLPSDLVAYFELMATESEETPVKDAALMIEWYEILVRAEKQEQFIKEYSSSTQVEPVRRLLKHYVTFALFGCDNTPLFLYDTKRMDPEARKVYTEYVQTHKDGDFFALLAEFLNLLEANDYCLTKEVDDFRTKALAAW